MSALIRFVTLLSAVFLIGTGCVNLDSIFVFPPTFLEGEHDFSSAGLGSLEKEEWNYVQLDPAGYGGRITGTPVSGIRISAPGAVPYRPGRKVILHFPGNASTLFASIRFGMAFRALGVDSFGIEYRGTGISGPGFSISEASILDDGEIAYRYLTRTLGISPSDIVILGYSIGSSVAVDLASRYPVAGLVLMSAMYNADAIATHLGGGYYIASRHFISVRLDNASKIRSVACPVLLLHGMKDLLIPWVQSEELQKHAVSSPRTNLYLDPESDHTALPGHADWFSPLISEFLDPL